MEALRPDEEIRDRVVASAMQSIRAEPGSWSHTALVGSARFLRPVLMAAALIVLLLILPNGLHPDTRDAGVLLSVVSQAPPSWLRWSVLGDAPDPREILVVYSETRP